MEIEWNSSLHEFPTVSILLFAIAYFLVYFFQVHVMTDFEFLPSASLLFLPAGVKLLAMLSGRWHGLLGLYLGKLSVDFFLLDAAFAFEILVTHPVIWILPAFVALQLVMGYFKVTDDLSNLKTVHLIFIAMVTSLTSALAMQTHLVFADEAHISWVKGVWSMAMGDVSGIVCTLMVVMIWRRMTAPKQAAH
jgi:K+-sensing histidine kinase KdpD